MDFARSALLALALGVGASAAEADVFAVDRVFDAQANATHTSAVGSVLTAINTPAEEFDTDALAIESKSNDYLDIGFADAPSNANTPGSVIIRVQIRPQTTWDREFRLDLRNGSTVIATTTVPLDGTPGTDASKGQIKVFDWNVMLRFTSTWTKRLSQEGRLPLPRRPR